MIESKNTNDCYTCALATLLNLKYEEVPYNKQTVELVVDILPNFISNNLIPYRFSPSIDEGLCVMFKQDNIMTYLEFYDDGDIGIIAEDIKDKKVLMNEDISKDQIIDKLIQALLGIDCTVSLDYISMKINESKCAFPKLVEVI
jgi:hypothetical protein